MSNGIKDLKLWREAVTLAADVLRQGRHAARRDNLAFLDRVVSAAAAVPVSIAEGYGQPNATDQQRSFECARSSLATLETQLAIARQAGLVNAEALTHLLARTATVGRLLGGYLTYVERQRSAETDEGVLRISPPTAGASLRKTVDEINCA